MHMNLFIEMLRHCNFSSVKAIKTEYKYSETFSYFRSLQNNVPCPDISYAVKVITNWSDHDRLQRGVSGLCALSPGFGTSTWNLRIYVFVCCICEAGGGGVGYFPSYNLIYKQHFPTSRVCLRAAPMKIKEVRNNSTRYAYYYWFKAYISLFLCYRKWELLLFLALPPNLRGSF